MKEDIYFESERGDIIALIPDGARRLLDVGCGFGMMGKRLKEERGAEVIGIESEDRAISIASGNIDKVIVGDVESLKLPFERGYFDCIVYGDILEHLKDPWALLKKHANYLKRGGLCIASIPNVAHYSIIKNLLKDRWEYRSQGLLDKTHLRFFTISGIRRMFEEAGYVIEEIKRIDRASPIKRLLNRLFLRKFKHLLTEQYIIKARLD